MMNISFYLVEQFSYEEGAKASLRTCRKLQSILLGSIWHDIDYSLNSASVSRTVTHQLLTIALYPTLYSKVLTNDEYATHTVEL